MEFKNHIIIVRLIRIALNPLCLFILITAFAHCGPDSRQETNHTTPIDTVTGSTLKNINESEHVVIQFEIDGKPCFATINQAFKSFKNKQAFPLSLWITVETQQRNPNGHPTNDETTLFNNIEDSLIETFDKKTPFCFIGRTTRDGYREIMFYVRDKQRASETMDNFIKANRFKRTIKYEINRDENWESVSGLYK